MINLTKIYWYADRYPGRVAIYCDDGDVTWQRFKVETEEKIYFLLNNFGNSLPSQICYICENCTDLISWLAACSTLKIPVTGLDYTLPFDVLQPLIESLGADLLILSDTNSEFSKYDALPNLNVVRVGEGAVGEMDYDDSIFKYIDKVCESDRPFRGVGLTSGTSGMSKVVVRSKPFDQRRFSYFTQRYNFNEDDRFLVSMPLYHAAGNGWARMFMSIGAALYIKPMDNAETLAETLDDSGITASVMTPSILGSVLDVLSSKPNPRVRSLRWLLVGGKYFPVSEKERAIALLGDVVYEYYGTTETGVNTIAEPHDLRLHPRSVGRAFDGNDIAIIGSHGERLGCNKPGTIAVSSYMNMDDYLDGGASKIYLDGQTYLLTADSGYLDSTGRLYLMNRSSHVKSEYNLYHLEDVLRNLDFVVDVAMLQPEKESAETIDCVLVVDPESDSNSILLDQVRLLANKEGLYCRRVLIAPEIPYSPSGKVRARDLASMFCSSQTA